MLLSTLLTTSALVAGALASPLALPHVVHERRSSAPSGWTRRNVLDRRAILPMKVALAQSNLDKGHEWLMEVSHPESNKFGKHWTAKDVAQAFAPSDETVDAVKTWLAGAGISDDRIRQSQSLNWLHFDASVDEAESLLNAKYHVWEHEATGQPHVACDQYSIPANLKRHIDFVYPTVHFDAKVIPRDNELRAEKRDLDNDVARTVGQPGSGSLPKLGQWLTKNKLIKELKDCDKQITPNCLRALYRFGPNDKAVKGNSYGIVEYTPQAYVPTDLDLFFANFSVRQVGDRPITDLIDGAVVQQQNKSFSFNGESDLDLEYGMTLVYPQPVTLYQVGDLVEGASFNNFLDALDASYCAGDDPTEDPIYPDPYKGGYKGPENCGGFSATKVISTSYGYDEADLTAAYEIRQCNEYMKLGLLGTSVLYSSGDYGVAGNGGECINPNSPGNGPNATFTNGTYGIFNPSFPATCPYVTAVGATQVKNDTNIIKALATNTQPESACETVIFSGGGFSNVFPLPSYQRTAVKNWFRDHPPPYGADRFNNSQQTRGHPDISANGANYVIAIDGTFSLVFGTSASSPTLGSIITLINQERLLVGKSTVGFINPTAYAHPQVFNDVTVGGNRGCGTPGFSAAPGWDPVTGLGTPNFPKMLALWLSLP